MPRGKGVNMRKLNSVYDIEDMLDVKETNGSFVFYLLVEYEGNVKRSVRIFTDREEANYAFSKLKIINENWGGSDSHVELIEKVVD